MKLFRTTLLAALLLASTQVSHAQAPGTPGVPGAPSAAGTTDAGAISNTTTTTTTTVNPSTTAGVSPDIAITETATLEGEDVTLANTGGAPALMSLAGLTLAAIAFGLRRKVSA